MKPTLTDAGKNQLIADKCPGRFTVAGGWWYCFPQNAGQFPCLGGSIIDDLNAMHEVENWLDDNLWRSYTSLLADLRDDCDAWRNCASATSHQRADAFAKVFNLW